MSVRAGRKRWACSWKVRCLASSGLAASSSVAVLESLRKSLAGLYFDGLYQWVDEESAAAGALALRAGAADWSLSVFELRWKSLAGLYLEGLYQCVGWESEGCVLPFGSWAATGRAADRTSTPERAISMQCFFTATPSRAGANR